MRSRAVRRFEFLRFLRCGLLASLFISCGRGPTLLVIVENIPAQAQSLQPLVTHDVSGVKSASIDDLSSMDLPQPTQNRQSFLLRLDDKFQGEISAYVAAFASPGAGGCLLADGSASRDFMPKDDAVVVSLKDPVEMDTACSGPLRVTSVVEAKGPAAGGKVVTVNGWGFKPGAEVYFGGSKASTVTFMSALILQVTTPRAQASGPVAVRVKNPDGAEGQKQAAYSYSYDNLQFDTPLLYPNAGSITSIDAMIGNFDGQGDPDAANLTSVNVLGVTRVPSLDRRTYSYGATAQVTNLVIADFDKNGSLDIATALGGSAMISLRVNDGQGLFDTVYPYPTTASPKQLLTGDVNNDAVLDFITLHATSFSVVMNMGGLQFSLPATFNIPTKISMPLAATLLNADSDVYLDLVVVDADPTKKQFGIIRNKRDGSFDVTTGNVTTTALQGTPSAVTAGDLNDDGINDLLIPMETANKVCFGLFSSLGFGSSLTYLNVPGGPRRVGLGDLNGDGMTDLVVASASQMIHIFLQQLRAQPTDPLFQNSPSASVATTAPTGNIVRVQAVDLQPADGKIDIFVVADNVTTVLFNKSF